MNNRASEWDGARAVTVEEVDRGTTGRYCMTIRSYSASCGEIPIEAAQVLDRSPRKEETPRTRPLDRKKCMGVTMGWSAPHVHHTLS